MAFSQDKYSSSIPVSAQCFGENNRDRILYVIYRTPPGAGFFSNVFHVLGHLHVAESMGLIPVVDMKNFPTLYNEEEFIHGTANAWEYYFAQPLKISLEEAYSSKHVLFSDGQFRGSIYEETARASVLAERFLKIKDTFLVAADAFQKAMFTSGTTLGVHFRGQEHKSAVDHPSCPTPAQMIERTHFLLNSHTINTIFIVSEEQEYVDLFVRHFGKMVVCTDAFRTYGINAYHMRPYPRANHMYKLGRDVLVDTLLLARTNYLLASGRFGIASGSNVSRMAQVLNNGRYKHVELIYNGINRPTPPFFLTRMAGRAKRSLLKRMGKKSQREQK